MTERSEDSVPTRKETNKPAMKWSDTMKADTSLQMDACVQVALDRTVQITRYERAMGKFIHEVAMQYANCNQGLHHALNDIPADKDGLKNKLSGLRGHYKGVSIKYMQQLYPALQKSIQSSETAINASRSQYIATRNQALEMRKQFRFEKQKLRETIESAELQIVRWYNAYDLSVPEEDSAQPALVEVNAAAKDDDDDGDEDGDNATAPAWARTVRRLGQCDASTADATVARINDVMSQHGKILECKRRYDTFIATYRKTWDDVLNKFQTIDDSGLAFLAETVLRPIVNRRDVVPETRIANSALNSATKSQQQDKEDNLAVTLEKKRKDIMANLFQQKNVAAYEPGQGVFEAETLGLPRAIGELRDNLKAKFADHANQLASLRLIATILDRIVVAADKLVDAIQRLAQDGEQNRNDPITLSKQQQNNRQNDQQQQPQQTQQTQHNQQQRQWKVSAASVGPITVGVTDQIMQAFLAEARAIAEWSQRIRHVRQNKINPFLSTAAKQMQLELDSDDAAWTMLCDAARRQSKVASKYKQTLLDNEKIRERARSTDTLSQRSTSEDFDADNGSPGTENGSNSRRGSLTSPRSGNKFSKALSRLPSLPGRSSSAASESSNNEGSEAAFNPKKVTQAFGNMLSATANSAGNAMKNLNLDGGLGVGAKKEVDETKGRQTLDSADANKSRAMTSYKSFTEERLKKVMEYEQHGASSSRTAWDAMLSGLEVLNVSNAAMKEAEDIIKVECEKLSQENSHWLTGIASKIAPMASQKQGDNLLELNLHGLDRSTGSSAIDYVRTLNDENDGKTKSSAAADDDEDLSDAFVETVQGLRTQYHDRLEMAKSNGASNGSPSRRQGLMSSDSRPDQSQGMNPSELPEVRAKRSFSETFFENGNKEQIPQLVASYTCTYRPKDKGLSLTTPINGMLYVTESALYVATSNDRKFITPWTSVVSLKKEKSFIGGENAILLTHKSSKDTSAFVIGKLQNRDETLSQMQRILAKAMPPPSSPPTAGDVAAGTTGIAVNISPDSVVNKKMVRIFEKSLYKVDIPRFYNVVFSEGDGTTGGPFYGDFLTKEGCFELKVGDWEFAKDGEPFEASWCGESYTQRRTVKFKFNRKTHLYIGPPVAEVKQTQYCRIEGKERCIVAMVLSFDGIPYADCFYVHARWATRKDGVDGLKVEVGIQVEFRKKTILASQIKTGTIAETTPVHQRLFEEARKALGVDAPQGDDEAEEEPVDRSMEAAATVATSEGIFGSLQGIISMIPVNRSFLFGAGTVLGLVLLNGWLAGGGADHVSSNEIRAMKAQMDEMQQTLQQVLLIVNSSSNNNRSK